MSNADRPLVSRLFPRAATQSSLSGSSLPADLETAAAHRLGALALVVSIVATVLGTVAQLAGQGAALGPRVRLALIAADVLLSFGLYAAIARGWITARRALRLGLGYQVAHALLISVVFHALTLTPGAVVRGWTSVAVWTVLYPLIVPSRPGRVWFASLATALMDPIGLWVNFAAGAPVPSASEIAQRLFPTVFACILAPIAARIVYGLTVEVHKAREMGSYRLVEKLGEGGMGEVWRAEHRMLARGAAIKLIRPALGGVAGAPETEMVKRFEREARATAALRSPHTIEVYDYGVAADGTFHYVMELLEGFSLQTLVERFGPVPPERAVGLLRQACHSLAEAHASGLVHRDVKPANMFVCQLGLDVDFVKVLDFGLVKRRGPQAREEALTVAGAFTGTPAFMPPEIALGAERIDGRADIYALGCVAYWLLTGQRVFESGSAMQMVVDHIRTPAVPPSRRGGPSIPPALEEIVLRCLEKDPGARPPSAASLSLELKALDLEGQWTEERAQAWWRAHPPTGPEKPAAPTLDVDDSRQETQSRLERRPPMISPHPSFWPGRPPGRIAPRPAPSHAQRRGREIHSRRFFEVPMTQALSRAALCLTLLAAALPAPADDGKIDRDKDPLKGVEFRLVGPFIGGRVARVAGVAGDPRTYFAATASGGVWKSTNGGQDWKPVFDDQPVASIGSIAVAPSDPSVVYVGSGEANIRGNVAAGNGIYKSTDGGTSWTQVWKQEGQIGTLVVHPKNPDVAFAAVLGHAFGPNPERGVYRTRDGGKTWQQVLRKDADTGASDVALDPSNPSVVFAGLWQARRRPWEMTSGGPGSGLYVSRDGGETWKALTTTNGLPEGIWGKVGVAVAPSDSRRVYALIEAEKGGLFRSDDGGESWSLASGHHALRQRAWYYSTITVDPRNPDVLWCPQVPMLKSVDGGRTWKKVKGIHHGDHHDLWIDPADTRRMVSANDGGVDVTVDGGESWSSPRLPLGQCYHVEADGSQPYRVSCALQDLGTASGPSNSLSSDGINHGDWYDVGGGEAGHTASDPSDPNIVYAGEYLGILTRYDHRTGQARAVGAWPDNQSGHGGEDGRYRFQWTAPIVVSPHDPKVVYHGGNVLFRTRDGGQTWTAISPDLTTNDKTKQKWSGGPITGDNTGVEHYCTIFAVAESPLTAGLIWVGSDDGLVHVTRDGGATWTNVTANIRGIPAFATVDLIEASRFDAGTAYVVADAHRLDDTRPYLFKTTDYGKTWKSLSAGLAPDVYLHAVREDPKRRGLLYAGTERGVMLSRDDGATWEPLKLNLPTVAVHDLVVKGDDLVLGTHGRSIWILDDLTPIREMSAEVRSKAVHLFPAPVTTAWRYRGSFHEDGPGENPPAGLVVQYWLKEKPKGEVTLEVRDAAGALVRRLSSKNEEDEVPPEDPDSDRSTKRKPPLTAEAGVNRGRWNLMWAGATKIKRAKIDTGNPENGPLALPGTYTLKLSADGQTATGTVEVRPDPRVQMTAAERAEQLRFGLEVRDAITRLAGIVEGIRSVRDQLRGRSTLLAGNGAAASWIKSAGEVVPRLDALESELHNPKAEVSYDILAQRGGAKLYSQITPLLDWVRDADGVPTQGMKEIFAERMKELARLEADWKGLQASRIQPLNEQARALGLTYVAVPAETSRD